MLTIDYLNNLDARIRQNRMSSMEAKSHLDKIKCALEEIGEDSGTEFAVQERTYWVIDAHPSSRQTVASFRASYSEVSIR